jgi:hypothetical protein
MSLFFLDANIVHVLQYPVYMIQCAYVLYTFYLDFDFWGYMYVCNMYD